MYSTCISCHTALGENSVLELFPVGRRLAFDPHRGRLWVLCSACRSWNLAPLEERWEAVEAAERLFETAALGASTETVALGRVQEGTELLRIGKVDRPEFAAWRYGRQLVRRRRAFWLDPSVYGSGLALGGVGVGAVVAGVAWAPMVIPAGLAGYAIYGLRSTLRDLRRTVLSLGPERQISLSHAYRARFVRAQVAEGWTLAVPLRKGEEIALGRTDALRLLRAVLPGINHTGGTTAQVREAVAELERRGSVESVLGAAAQTLQDTDHHTGWGAKPGQVAGAQPTLRLVLEMAANEETERRALEGELSLLEREWRDAEELAAIADSLLFPRHLAQRIQQWKNRSDLPVPSTDPEESGRG